MSPPRFSVLFAEGLTSKGHLVKIFNNPNGYSQESGRNEDGMEIDDLDVWGRNPPVAWAREAAERWASLAKRAALLYMDLFVVSPLPRTETEVLVLVWENPNDAEPARLAEMLRVSRQSMTGILDKLERDGFLKRTAHPTDRRRKILRLQSKGKALVCAFVRSILWREAVRFSADSERDVSETLDRLDSLFARTEAWNREHPL